MIYADPIEVLKKMPAGTMLFGRASFDGQPMETYFAIKEESRYMKRLGKYPILNIRTGLLQYNGIPLVCVMMQPNGDMDMLYETWFNYNATDGFGQKSFEDLTHQDNIVFWFIDEKGNERKIGIKNSLKDAFSDYVNKIALINPWTMQEFDRARNMLYADYPSPAHLWNTLAL